MTSHIRDTVEHPTGGIQYDMQHSPSLITHRAIRRWMVCLFILMLCGCGSERTYSGIWREVSCTDDDPETECRGELYELHLGRFGQKLTGVAVRYTTEEGLDTFERSYACGCFFLRGGRVNGSDVSFGLLNENATCSTQDQDAQPQHCRDCNCENRRFELQEVDGILMGRMLCDDGRVHTLRFEQSEGKTRRRCVDLLDE